MTVIVTVFSPSFHVALAPLFTAVPSTSIATDAPASFAVAVMAFVVFVVAAVYALTAGSNDGVKASDPIDSPDRVAFKGLLFYLRRL